MRRSIPEIALGSVPENLMLVKLGRWEIRSGPAKQARDGRPPKHQMVRIFRTITFGEPDLDLAVADFITRHVLERDSELFDG